MKALTLIQPWAYAVEHLGKPVENRTWKPPAAIIGKRIAIHAGKSIDRDTLADFVEDGVIVNPKGIPRGAITCSAIVRGWVEGDQEILPSARRLFGWSKPLTEAEALEALRCRWWAGPVGWVLGDVISIDGPVACSGALGLWTVPPGVADLVRAREATS